uniref:Uncharacterized protein n=1 Tax=Arundo donax TaxID=35708 RepID=A0A0A8Z0F3_ARUDO
MMVAEANADLETKIILMGSFFLFR